MKNLFDSLVRTYVPIIVGTILGFLVSKGVEVSPDLEVALTATLTSVFSVIWYTGARLLEVYVAPKFGWLLGKASEPTYNGEGH